MSKIIKLKDNKKRTKRKKNEVNKEEVKRLLKNYLVYNVNGKKVKLEYEEKDFLETIIEFGYEEAKKWIIENKSKSTFYRWQRRLINKGINPKNIPENIYNELKKDIEKNKSLFPQISYEVIFEA